MKRGYTLVEMLIVVSLITILFGFAIMNMQKVDPITAKQKCEHDAKNAITTQKIFHAENEIYDIASGVGTKLVSVIFGENGAKFSISIDNHLETEPIICEDGSDGFRVLVYNVFEKNKSATAVQFNSCTDGRVH